ncbi:MAG: methylated-DNA--[Clostridia bacterium]|nr:methylated-DNA--[protein]-cysteine S-methyltransferase [Clostridia bacterium]
MFEKILYHSHFGTFRLVSDDYYIKKIAFCKSEQENYTEQNTEKDKIFPKVMMEATKQLQEYLDGNRTDFTVPVLCDDGTAFQKAVWSALQRIPFGETRSYSQIAAFIGRPHAVRAVGSACGKNPVLILTPCHRVVGKHGELTGFAAGLKLKEMLLQLESKSEDMTKEIQKAASGR